MHASTNRKIKALHRAYTLITYLDPTAEIVRDSLHRLYKVNRYSIRVKFDQNRVSELTDAFLKRISDDLCLKLGKDSYWMGEDGLVLFVRQQEMAYFGSPDTLTDITFF